MGKLFYGRENDPLKARNTTVLLVSLPIRSGGLTSERFAPGGVLRIRVEPVEKPPNWSLFEASRLNSPKLGVKFFDRLMDYTL